MGGSAGNLIVDLVDLVINIYIILLFIRMFLTEYERYDAVLGMIFQATDPLVVPLATSLRSRAAYTAPLLLIGVLLGLQGLLTGSIPEAIQDFLGTLFKLYVLVIILTAAFREAYLNPIVNLGQRMARPVRRLALSLTPHPAAVSVVTVVMLVLAHTVALVVLYSFAGRGGGDELVLAKSAFIYTLRLIVNLSWFFVLVLFLYVLLPWFSPDPGNPLVQLLTLVATPILEPVRRVIPPLGGVLDLSPILAMFALQILNAFLHGLLNAL